MLSQRFLELPNKIRGVGVGQDGGGGSAESCFPKAAVEDSLSPLWWGLQIHYLQKTSSS